MNGQGVVLNRNDKTEVKQYFVYSEFNPKIINNETIQEQNKILNKILLLPFGLLCVTYTRLG